MFDQTKLNHGGCGGCGGREQALASRKAQPSVWARLRPAQIESVPGEGQADRQTGRQAVRAAKPPHDPHHKSHLKPNKTVRILAGDGFVCVSIRPCSTATCCFSAL